jgi:16S rRNA processing protein RimM
VSGHRGAKGELTVRLGRGDAAPWTALKRIWIGDAAAATAYEIESSRAYRDRLVLKLAGIDRATQAAALRGMNVHVARGEEPDLPDEVYLIARLVGMDVRDEQGDLIGRVSDVVPTAGADLLIVEREAREKDEAMIPLAKEIVIEVRETSNEIIVRLPAGLLDINNN